MTRFAVSSSKGRRLPAPDPRSRKRATTSPQRNPAERAARIAAMLDRWDAENVSDEPEWDSEDLEPMALRQLLAPT